MKLVIKDGQDKYTKQIGDIAITELETQFKEYIEDCLINNYDYYDEYSYSFIEPIELEVYSDTDEPITIIKTDGGIMDAIRFVNDY